MKNKMGGGGTLDHPLMRNNITRDDLDNLINYLQGDDPRLTQGSNVQHFEEEWSEWLGVKYSVFVNSGSSANLISMAVLRDIGGLGDIIVPTLTWVSDIAAVINVGFRPIFVDINPNTLCMDTKEILKKINSSTRGVFLTHAQGFNGLTEELVDKLRIHGIPLIEDVCESHGAIYKGKKVGTYSLISNFSFYYAHHMSTIEGGMACTNDEEIYQILRMYRSHGMVRESTNDEIRDRYKNLNSSLTPDFIFAYPGYNMRNTELGAVLGRSQLCRLDRNNKLRKKNLEMFLENLDSSVFFTEFELEGNSNYAFPLILREANDLRRDHLEELMAGAGIEFRRGSSGGGNQMRQPYLKGHVTDGDWVNYPNVEHVHFYGWYIGNYPELTKEKILGLCGRVNSVS